MTDVVTTAVDPVLPALKPGYKTSEFYLSSAATILSILFASGLLHDGSMPFKIAGLAATALIAAGYSVSRGLAKSG